MYNGNKFKNIMGSHLLKALFFEEAVDTDRPDVLYTLKLDDHLGYVSIHKAYVAMEDATEYEFALKYFDGWSHWKKLTACNWFKPFLDDMREELEVKLKARALNQIRKAAEDLDNKSSYVANKFIVDQGLHVKKDNRGRPSKEKIVQEANKLFQTKEEVDEDYERIQVN